jgi:hypothetical protein
MKVAEVSSDDVDALHAEISRTRPVRANRVIEVVRKAFNMAIRWGWCPESASVFSPLIAASAVVAPDPRPSRRSQAKFPLIGLSEFGQPPLCEMRV